MKAECQTGSASHGHFHTFGLVFCYSATPRPCTLVTCQRQSFGVQLFRRDLWDDFLALLDWSR